MSELWLIAMLTVWAMLATFVMYRLHGHLTDLRYRITELEFRESARELYGLPPDIQLERLKLLIDERLREIDNGRN